MRPSAVETLAMGSGLGLLGLAAGTICGMTVTSGAAQTLLTGLFTFTGGTILSYSAFAVRASPKKIETPSATAPPNVVRVGVGLGTLSGGLIIGAVLGLWFRYRDPLHLAPTPPPGGGASETKVSSVPQGASLQSSHEDDQTLDRVRDRLGRNFYTAPDVLGDITDLKAIADKCLAHK